MNRMHHPTDARLFAYAAGMLDAGQQLLVGAHLEFCSSCRRAVTAFEHVGGALLADLPPTPMTDGAHERAQARSLVGVAADRAPAPLNDMAELPGMLRLYPLSRWQWIGPGVHWRSMTLPVESQSRVFLLKAQPGTKLPQHTHSDTELTLVLKGAFTHELGCFARGDLDDADDSVEHQPVVSSDEECICLVAMQGNLLLRGLLGRIMQPLVRF